MNRFAIIVIALASFTGCRSQGPVGSAADTRSPAGGIEASGRTLVRIDYVSDREADIFPDYKDVTVPCNIAPLNFNYLGDEEARLLIEGESGSYLICAGKGHLFPGRKGLFSFRRSIWHRLMRSGGPLKFTVVVRDGDEWTALKPFTVNVSAEKIDPFLSYRLLPPGYQAWMRMGLYQRNMETYSQTPIFENKLTDRNCVNCHSFPQRDPSKLLFHSRALFGGTLMIKDGSMEKLNTKTDSTISPLVYPYWHPSGKYVAFSVNKTNQSFFNHDPNRIEVYDSASDVVVYDVDNHRIAYSELTKSPKAFETFPTFSPGGRSLCFCSAEAVDSMPEKYAQVKYSLCRISFNPDDCSFGNDVDTLFNSGVQGKSVSFPRFSPDGRFLVFTLHGYGNFSIWHKDADLWAIDLNQSGREAFPLSAANSDDVESYHSWSGNSRWLVFSSRRGDGLYTRPYISHIDGNGLASKPFLLPQKNPKEYYQNLMVSYNIPEFISGKVKVSRYKMSRTLRKSEGIDVTVKTD